MIDPSLGQEGFGKTLIELYSGEYGSLSTIIGEKIEAYTDSGSKRRLLLFFLPPEHVG